MYVYTYELSHTIFESYLHVNFLNCLIELGLRAENFISITGWLLGPSAKCMLGLMPNPVGKIGSKVFEVERVRV